MKKTFMILLFLSAAALFSNEVDIKNYVVQERYGIPTLYRESAYDSYYYLMLENTGPNTWKVLKDLFPWRYGDVINTDYTNHPFRSIWMCKVYIHTELNNPTSYPYGKVVFVERVK